MATIALPRSIPHYRPSSPIPLAPLLSLDVKNHNTAPVPIPNKHLPICPTGPAPAEKPDTPPASPPNKETDITSTSVLYPPDCYDEISSEHGTIYTLSAAEVAAALDHISRQPLPDPSEVFPWLHGLHPGNHIQQAFFVARRRALRKTPRCWRGITVVKAGGDLNCSRLKGALSPDEFLQAGHEPEFKEVDPREGFSVRNFQIQAAKSTMLSDIIVYGEDESQVRKLAWDIAAAQQEWRELHEKSGHELPHYNTFLCLAPFKEFERNHPEIVAINSRGQMTGEVMDFFHQERVEMSTMTRASEIANNVWLGPTPDQSVDNLFDATYDILIECSDLARLDVESFKQVAAETGCEETCALLDFPSSGSIMPPSDSLAETDAIVQVLRYIYYLANGTRLVKASSPADTDGDVIMSTGDLTARPRKILIHCTDGYTETSMLALAYYIYSTGCTVAEAWLQLHVEKKRNFFAYPSDVALLNAIAPRILAKSPALDDRSQGHIVTLLRKQPRWLASMDGSLPSRIFDYMYLGNLGHANNPALLKAMGIGQILSVGETATWKDGEREKWSDDNICIVKGVQDNGVDPLTNEFARCLAFIERGRRNNTATLVHCRVGVSRSATICIAEVMKELNLSYPRAYCFVRARRLNVIIQPHLRFSYELLKWEEGLDSLQSRAATDDSQYQGRRKRECEWAEIAREIAAMNRPYSR